MAFIPGIQIREYLPDTSLNQFINFCSGIIGAITKAMTSNKKKNESSTNTLNTDTQAKGETKSFSLLDNKAINWALKYLTGSQKENLYTDLKDLFKKESSRNVWNTEDNTCTYVLDFPYILYYKFLACQTTALYELPCISENKLLYSADGTGGWKTDRFELTAPFLDKIPLLRNMFGNIRINYQANWDAKDGYSTKEPEINIKFDLFNDTLTAALMNFIFINTIVPSNRWIQYNMFQQASNLYDIKIEGSTRMFACTGKFEVSYGGILREPSMQFFNTLVNVYKNDNYNITPEKLQTQHIIKIPDVYHVSMTFASIFPANFNNYIYSYVINNNIMEDYKDKTRDESMITKAFTTAIDKFTDGFSKRWNNQNYDD